MPSSVDVSPSLPDHNVVDSDPIDPVFLSEFTLGRLLPLDIFAADGTYICFCEDALLSPSASGPSFIKHVAIVVAGASHPEVSWVAALSNVAGMANVLVLGNGAERKFIGDTMSTATGRSFDDLREPPVSLVHDESGPRPTTIRASTSIDMTPEPRLGRHANTLSQGRTR